MWFELIEKIIKYLILFLIGVLLFIVIHKVYKKCIDGFSISAQSNYPYLSNFLDVNLRLTEKTIDDIDSTDFNNLPDYDSDDRFTDNKLQSSQKCFHYYNDNNPIIPLVNRLKTKLGETLSQFSTNESSYIVDIYNSDNNHGFDNQNTMNSNEYIYISEEQAFILNIINNIELFPLIHMFDNDNMIYFIKKESIINTFGNFSNTINYDFSDIDIRPIDLTFIYLYSLADNTLLNSVQMRELFELISIKCLENIKSGNYSENSIYYLLYGEIPENLFTPSSDIFHLESVKNLMQKLVDSMNNPLDQSNDFNDNDLILIGNNGKIFTLFEIYCNSDYKIVERLDIAPQYDYIRNFYNKGGIIKYGGFYYWLSEYKNSKTFTQRLNISPQVNMINVNINDMFGIKLRKIQPDKIIHMSDPSSFDLQSHYTRNLFGNKDITLNTDLNVFIKSVSFDFIEYSIYKFNVTIHKGFNDSINNFVYRLPKFVEFNDNSCAVALNNQENFDPEYTQKLKDCLTITQNMDYCQCIYKLGGIDFFKYLKENKLKKNPIIFKTNNVKVLIGNNLQNVTIIYDEPGILSIEDFVQNNDSVLSLPLDDKVILLKYDEAQQYLPYKNFDIDINSPEDTYNTLVGSFESSADSTSVAIPQPSDSLVDCSMTSILSKAINSNVTTYDNILIQQGLIEGFNVGGPRAVQVPPPMIDTDDPNAGSFQKPSNLLEMIRYCCCNVDFKQQTLNLLKEQKEKICLDLERITQEFDTFKDSVDQIHDVSYVSGLPIDMSDENVLFSDITNNLITMTSLDILKDTLLKYDIDITFNVDKFNDDTNPIELKENGQDIDRLRQVAILPTVDTGGPQGELLIEHIKTVLNTQLRRPTYTGTLNVDAVFDTNNLSKLINDIFKNIVDQYHTDLGNLVLKLQQLERLQKELTEFVTNMERFRHHFGDIIVSDANTPNQRVDINIVFDMDDLIEWSTKQGVKQSDITGLETRIKALYNGFDAGQGTRRITQLIELKLQEIKRITDEIYDASIGRLKVYHKFITRYVSSFNNRAIQNQCGLTSTNVLSTNPLLLSSPPSLSQKIIELSANNDANAIFSRDLFGQKQTLYEVIGYSAKYFSMQSKLVGIGTTAVAFATPMIIYYDEISAAQKLILLSTSLLGYVGLLGYQPGYIIGYPGQGQLNPDIINSANYLQQFSRDILIDIVKSARQYNNFAPLKRDNSVVSLTTLFNKVKTVYSPDTPNDEYYQTLLSEIGLSDNLDFLDKIMEIQREDTRQLCCRGMNNVKDFCTSATDQLTTCLCDSVTCFTHSIRGYFARGGQVVVHKIQGGVQTVTDQAKPFIQDAKSMIPNFLSKTAAEKRRIIDDITRWNTGDLELIGNVHTELDRVDLEIFGNVVGLSCKVAELYLSPLTQSTLSPEQIHGGVLNLDTQARRPNYDPVTFNPITTTEYYFTSQGVSLSVRTESQIAAGNRLMSYAKLSRVMARASQNSPYNLNFVQKMMNQHKFLEDMLHFTQMNDGNLMRETEIIIPDFDKLMPNYENLRMPTFHTDQTIDISEPGNIVRINKNSNGKYIQPDFGLFYNRAWIEYLNKRMVEDDQIETTVNNRFGVTTFDQLYNKFDRNEFGNGNILLEKYNGILNDFIEDAIRPKIDIYNNNIMVFAKALLSLQNVLTIKANRQIFSRGLIAILALTALLTGVFTANRDSPEPPPPPTPSGPPPTPPGPPPTPPGPPPPPPGVNLPGSPACNNKCLTLDTSDCTNNVNNVCLNGPNYSRFTDTSQLINTRYYKLIEYVKQIIPQSQLCVSKDGIIGSDTDKICEQLNVRGDFCESNPNCELLTSEERIIKQHKFVPIPTEDEFMPEETCCKPRIIDGKSYNPYKKNSNDNCNFQQYQQDETNILPCGCKFADDITDSDLDLLQGAFNRNRGAMYNTTATNMDTNETVTTNIFTKMMYFLYDSNANIKSNKDIFRLCDDVNNSTSGDCLTSNNQLKGIRSDKRCMWDGIPFTD